MSAAPCSCSGVLFPPDVQLETFDGQSATLFIIFLALFLLHRQLPALALGGSWWLSQDKTGCLKSERVVSPWSVAFHRQQRACRTLFSWAAQDHIHIRPMGTLKIFMVTRHWEDVKQTTVGRTFPRKNRHSHIEKKEIGEESCWLECGQERTLDNAGKSANYHSH